MDDELNAICAIYCGDKELKILQRGDNVRDTILQLQIPCDIESDTIPVTVTLTMSPPYPCRGPDVAVHCPHVTRQQAEQIKTDLISYTNELVGQPMIMEIILWIKQNFSKYYICEEIAQSDGSSDMFTALLHIDHMRAKTKYSKTIQKWTEELGLTGRLIFFGNLIFVLLQGNTECIKDYLSRSRTVNVDVDSKGRNCKERMMKVLAEIKLENGQERLPEFQVVEVESLHQICDMFVSISLKSLFDVYLLPFFKKS